MPCCRTCDCCRHADALLKAEQDHHQAAADAALDLRRKLGLIDPPPPLDDEDAGGLGLEIDDDPAEDPAPPPKPRPRHEPGANGVAKKRSRGDGPSRKARQHARRLEIAHLLLTTGPLRMGEICKTAGIPWGTFGRLVGTCDWFGRTGPDRTAPYELTDAGRAALKQPPTTAD